MRYSATIDLPDLAAAIAFRAHPFGNGFCLLGPREGT